MVLTGVNIGAYGRDSARSGHCRRGRLVAGAPGAPILAETDVPRLRLSSIEPWDVTPDCWRFGRTRGSAATCTCRCRAAATPPCGAWGARTTPPSYATVLADARAALPELSLTTDVIVGFPGETDAEFAETLAFVERLAFARLHVFATRGARARWPYACPSRCRRRWRRRAATR